MNVISTNCRGVLHPAVTLFSAAILGRNAVARAGSIVDYPIKGSSQRYRYGDKLLSIRINTGGVASDMRRTRLAHALLTAALILFCANFACAGDRNLLPKYGSLPKTEWEKATDAKFIAAIDEQYHGDRKKAAADLAMRGWQYLSQQNFAEAMRRFNQAWLLDNKNGIALWGMAAIEASSEKFDESLRLFAEAEKSVTDEINFSVDYAKAVGMAGAQRNDNALLKDAFDRFERICHKAPQNTKNLQNWAITLFRIGKYPEAWEKVKLAEATPNKDELDPHFIAALQSRMPRPPN
jgi:tetratricopeptide (TPR) repeat protein